MEDEKLTDVDQKIEASLGDYVQPDQKTPDMLPMFKVVGNQKIPVSKVRGPLWKSRKDQARRALESQNLISAWDEAIAYYKNDQVKKRGGRGEGNVGAHDAAASELNDGYTETENIVFANVSALVPMLYTKNPDFEVTAHNTDLEEFVPLWEKLIDVLMRRKTAPGLNLKPKTKRAVVIATLTNLAWFEVGFVRKEEGGEAALEALNKLSQTLQSATKKSDIEQAEGDLFALEETIDLLSPSGPWTKVRLPHQVLIDPAANEADLSDAAWVIVEDYLYTSYIRAKYATKNEDGAWETIYAPTHVLQAGGAQTHDELVNSFSLFTLKDEQKFSDYGYNDQASFNRGLMSKVYWVWDKATRRLEMYNDSNWCYPIWVWDDPYKLDQFFPLVPLSFHTDPVSIIGKGEVTYYLDQQDGINQVNTEKHRWRDWASKKLVYDVNSVDPALIDAYLTGTTGRSALGVKVPEGKTAKDMVSPMLPPSAEVSKVFDKQELLAAIDRISGVASVQRGVEYKTNTTNRAIESYESQMQTRADEKMDAIEEAIGQVGWLALQMCLQFMDQEQVAVLLGQKTAENWKNLSAQEIVGGGIALYTIGGSTLKPTSRAKKEQASQIAGIVGQFSRSTPAAVIVALKVLSKAYDEVVIEPEDWQMITQSIAAQLQRGAPAQEGQSPAGSQEQPQAEQQDSGVPEGMEAIVERVAGFIDQLPQEIKVKLGTLLARGVPIKEAAQTVINQMQQGS